jgi:GDPmannose 4,6-dehydratase
MKKALITGIRGQDGAYLAQFLLNKGYEVWGADRRTGDSAYWRLEELGIMDDVKITYMDMLEQYNMMQVLDHVQPDEVYNLAAQSFVGVSFDQPTLTAEVDGLGVLRLLESIRLVNSKMKFYQASTSEMFGKVQAIPQSETTPFYPRSPYGVAKLYAHWITINYREAYDMFACSGILFNHESPLRGVEFVTRKITRAVANIKAGRQQCLELGNLDAKRDWGYAKEYVEGMWMMLQHHTPDDYVLATNETHSVQEFIDAAFAAIDVQLDWAGEGAATCAKDTKTGKVMVKINETFYRPAEVDLLIGDPAKANQTLGWHATTRFPDLVRLMVEADLRYLKIPALV